MELFKTPVGVGALKLKNRIVMAPYDTGKALNGCPSEEMIRHYRERAKGIGLVIVEHEHVLRDGMAHARQLSMARDDVIDDFKRLTDAIHEEGSYVFAQISHSGAVAKDSGLPPVAPSAVSVRGSDIPVEMNQDDIRRVVKGFADAAVRAKKAGFDGVEIHAAHGFLLNQFYSPLVNRRQDEYSVRPMENRIRLHLEIIRAIKEAVGTDFPVAIRFGGCDYSDNGSRISDIPQAVKAFEDAGADLIDISGGMIGSRRPGHTEPGYFKDMSLAAKTAVSVPIILTGGITAAQEMESLLKEQAADLIGIGRALNMDAQWAVKALAGY